MTPSQTNSSGQSPTGLHFESLRGPLLEWLVWMALGALVFSQTGGFDQEIREYAFGADGWPKALCIALFVGASGQLAYQVLQLSRGMTTVTAEASDSDAPKVRLSGWRLVQRLGIFLFPLVYLYFIPTLGFYLLTPFFVLGMLVILEVKSPLALLGVTSVVYGLFLLIFTRFFYVAVPVGNVEPFYSWNNAIIVFARSGL